MYETFAPAETRRLSEKRRIPDREALAGEVSAWEAERNVAESSMDWRFTTVEARIKLGHLYPEIVEEA